MVFAYFQGFLGFNSASRMGTKFLIKSFDVYFRKDVKIIRIYSTRQLKIDI